MTDAGIIQFFSQYAYEPWFVYGFIIMFMTASSFGLPLPEEMTLISAGLVAYMARNPAKFPPPTPDAEGVNLVVLCIVCFVSVLGSDLLIYMLGRIFGKKLIRSKFFNNRIGQERFNKINNVYQKYGHWACGLFRFTPGVRFPGHMSCGMMGIPLWKFIAIDGGAALLSVPTQVLLVAFYGEIILAKVKEFKMWLGGIILAIILVWGIKKLISIIKNRRVV
jgi:membrane protein DedA with SNARE-associated domain